MRKCDIVTEIPLEKVYNEITIKQPERKFSKWLRIDFIFVRSAAT